MEIGENKHVIMTMAIENRIWKYAMEMYCQSWENISLHCKIGERYLNSAVPQMQRMLNSYQEAKFKTLKQLNMPVTLDLC